MKKILMILTMSLCGMMTAGPVRSLVAVRNTVGAEFEAKTYTAADYIQDGLVAMWDGIENAGWGLHNESLQTGDVLRNLCGIDIVRLTNKTKIGDDYFEGPLEVSSFSQIKTAMENGEATIEIVAQRIDTGTSRINFFLWHYTSTANYIWLFQDRSTSGGTIVVWCYVNNFSMRPTLERNSRFSISATRDDYERKLLFNGFLTQITDPGIMMDDIIFAPEIGIAGVRISSIRVYSRSLTAEEIAHNYKIDKERFGL